MSLNLVVSALTAFALASALIPILARVARHIGLVDVPRGNRMHRHPTPLVGGVAMFVAFVFGILMFDISLAAYRMLFAGALILVVVGVLDDFRELSVIQRFGAQIAAGLLMSVGGGVELLDLGYLVSPDTLVSLGLLAVPVTVFSTIGVINAVNMTDGLDGLAASLALVTVAALGFTAWVAGESDAFGILVILGAVLGGFLLFNAGARGGALVFMGDAGSMFLGFVLAWFLIQFSQGENRLMTPVTALWIFALPLFDAVSMMLRRVLLGRSPFQGDREHLHHMLQAAGFSPKQTLAVMLFLALAVAGVGLAGAHVGVAEHWMFLGFLAAFGIHFAVLMRSWGVRRLLNRPLVR